MCEFRWLLWAALLVWPIGALRAQETKKPGDDASTPDAAAADVQDRRSPRSLRRQTTTRRDESKPDDSSKKPSDQGDSDVREDEIHFTREIPDDLGEALSLALSHNPLLLVAEAKLREAQAEYDQVSLSVVHDVTVAFREYAHEKKALEAINKSGRDVVPAKQILERQENVERAKARLVYMLGIDTRPEGRWTKVQLIAEPRGVKVAVREAPRSPGAPPRGAGELAISRELQAALNDRTEFDFSEQPLSDVLAYLAERHQLQFLKKGAGLPNSNLDMPVTANLKGVTVQAGLQALADLTQTSFVFRDYGILVICQPSEAEIYRESNAPMIAPAFLGRQPAGKPSQSAGDNRR